MATTKLTALTTKGVRAELQERINEVPQVWPAHCTHMPSTTQVEPYAMAGALPIPRQMIDGRRVQGLGQFNYNIENEEWELSFLIDRKILEDDQTGALRLRIGEAAGAWAINKEYLFGLMLINGASAGFVAYDANTFFHDTRTEGDSGTIDNKTTSAAATGTIPTATEFLDAMQTIKAQMWRFNDDKGRPGNILAMSKIRVLIPSTYERAAAEGLKAAMLSSTSNVFGQGLAQFDVHPFLAADTKMYVHAVGAPIKGIIYQERTKLEILIYDDPKEIDMNNGLLVTLRQRFKFAYGQFRRMVEHTFS